LKFKKEQNQLSIYQLRLKTQKMQKQLAASNRNLLVLIKKCVFYILHKSPHVFTNIEKFIKIYLGNLTPECENFSKTHFLLPSEKKFYIKIEQ